MALMITTPHAYLAAPANFDDEKKHNFIINQILTTPPGTEIPCQLAVDFVDAFGDKTSQGTIAGKIVTVLKFTTGEAVAVFSTGERVALRTL